MTRVDYLDGFNTRYLNYHLAGGTQPIGDREMKGVTYKCLNADMSFPVVSLVL